VSTPVFRQVTAALAILALVAGACRSSSARARGSDEVTRLGIFPNLTHAPGLVGTAEGILSRELAPTRVEVVTFSSGSEAGTAILSGALDAAYMGPVPTASLYLKSAKVVVVSGAVANGASLVVRADAGIDDPGDLRGRRVAVPGLGNTQDVALRTWLRSQRLVPRDEGGDVSVVAVGNHELPQLLAAGDIDGAWAPEPWPSLLVDLGLGEVLVDERSLWPGATFLTTHLVVSRGYIDAHPEVVRRLVAGNVEVIRFMGEHPEEARVLADRQLEAVGGADLPDEVLDRAWDQLVFTWEPLASSLQQNADRAHDLGILDEGPGSLMDVYRLEHLEAVLEERGLPPLEEAA
jgi:NitT/TauT family transport system substrate-binding protein